MTHVCPRCHTPVRTGPFTDQDTNTVEVLTVEDVTLPGSRVPRTRVHECGAGDETAAPTEDRAIQPVDWARREVLFLAREVCEYRGSEIGGKKLDQLAVALTTLDEKAAENRAAAAGPRAGDTDRALGVAVHTVKAAFPPDATIVICGDDVEETARVKRSDGSFQVTTRPKRHTGGPTLPAELPGPEEVGLEAQQYALDVAGYDVSIRDAWLDGYNAAEERWSAAANESARIDVLENDRLRSEAAALRAAAPTPALTTARARLLGAVDEILAQYPQGKRLSPPYVARLAAARADVRRELDAWRTAAGSPTPAEPPDAPLSVTLSARGGSR